MIAPSSGGSGRGLNSNRSIGSGPRGGRENFPVRKRSRAVSIRLWRSPSARKTFQRRSVALFQRAGRRRDDDRRADEIACAKNTHVGDIDRLSRFSIERSDRLISTRFGAIIPACGALV